MLHGNNKSIIKTQGWTFKFSRRTGQCVPSLVNELTEEAVLSPTQLKNLLMARSEPVMNCESEWTGTHGNSCKWKEYLAKNYQPDFGLTVNASKSVIVRSSLKLL